MNSKTAVFIRLRRPRAFSLIEVVIALGLVTFGLIAILALIPASAHSSKESSEDLALSLMIQSANADLHKQGLATLNALPATGAITYYFDMNGRPLSSAAGATYRCTAKPIAPANVVASPVNSTNFTYVQLQFNWPTTAPAANQQKTVVITSIGNYE